MSGKLKNVRALNLENLQSIILWHFGRLLPNKHKSPSCFSIKNTNFNSLSIFFIENYTKKNEEIKINENLNLDEIYNFLPVNINRKNMKESEFEISECKRFVLTNYSFVYSNYELTIPSEVSLSLIDNSDFIEPKHLSNYNLLAIDCEMLITENGKELGRVSLVDQNFNVIFDTFIKPKCRVINYMTQFSGLTPENINTGISFEDARKKLLKFIGINTYVVGHGLENDIPIFKIKHNLFIDTSHIFKTHENKRRKLKELIKSLFDNSIQTETHSSIEDAKSSLKLLKYKINEINELKLQFECHSYFQGLKNLNILKSEGCNGMDSILEIEMKLKNQNLNFVKISYEEFKLISKKENDILMLIYERDGQLKFVYET